MHGTDVLTCMDALMPRAQDVQERPTILLHSLRLGNCSRIVLPTDFRVGRMEVSALVGQVKWSVADGRT